ncbi:MAG: ACP S-malonyltransferase [Clostridia bacterium]|nr:ACP S-malonyltransferase [Clostridia bacterium]MBP3708489.1 ACP S-malonyltransferase [Clostridia bacterium]
MKIGFLFPGQGSQSIGMGKDLYENYEEAREIYDLVEKLTGVNVKSISFDGPEEVLNETKNTQLAILTQSLAILNILKKNGIEADISAGLSLGEYTALINADFITIEDGIKIVKTRGELMQSLVPNGRWKMAAILGLDEATVRSICNKVKSGFVVPANFNTIGQIVVSGDESAINEIEAIAKEQGAKKVMILNTAGPFHTEKLVESSKALKEELKKYEIKFNNNKKVIKNLDGKCYTENDDFKELLAKHIINPVRFTDVLKTMYDEGVDCFVEIGPGKTLAGFVKRMKFDGDIKIININSVDSLNAAITTLR